MSTTWRTQPERGATVLIRLIAWLALTLGRRTGRILLFPICAYFALVTPRARHASGTYLARVLGRPATRSEQFRHLLTFAQLILDRPFFIAGRHSNIEFRVHGADALRATLHGGKGCVLLSAHLGSFDALRVLGRDYGELRVRPLMFEANAQKVSAILHALNPELARDIIAVGSPDALLGVKEEIDRGVSIGILADRVFAEDRATSVPFFGSSARFPVGPWRVAHAVQAPVFLVFALIDTRGGYDIYVEEFAPRVRFERGQRDEQLRETVAHFARRLEHYCRQAPYNWFNFYDFWE